MEKKLFQLLHWNVQYKYFFFCFTMYYNDIIQRENWLAEAEDATDIP